MHTQATLGEPSDSFVHQVLHLAKGSPVSQELSIGTVESDALSLSHPALSACAATPSQLAALLSLMIQSFVYKCTHVHIKVSIRRLPQLLSTWCFEAGPST